MSVPLTELIVILALVLTNGLFAMSEMALVSARTSKLRVAARQGDKKAQTALLLIERPTHFLSTIQIGISLIGTLAGAFGGASLAQFLSAWLARYPSIRPYSNTIALGLVVLLITYLSLVLGEIVPKQLALNNAESIATTVASPLKLLSSLMSPVVYILTRSTEGVLRFLGQAHGAPRPLNEEDIRSLIAESNATGILSKSESSILDRVFQLGDRRASSVMQPRHDITWLDTEISTAENWERVVSTGYSQYPVCKGDLDTMLGAIHIRDLLEMVQDGKTLNLRHNLKQPLIVPESKPALEILDMFKKSGVHIAMVVNEFGGIEGIITLGDMLEALVGYLFTDVQTDTLDAMQNPDGSWILDGTLPIDECKELLRLRSWPDEESGRFQTIAGFIMDQLGHIPRPGEKLKWAGYQFEILAMDRHRIVRVLVKPGKE